MRVVLCLSLLCSTVLFSMDELNQDVSLDMHDPQNNARILSKKGILELDVAN
jgi:hypothetical protein